MRPMTPRQRLSLAGTIALAFLWIGILIFVGVTEDTSPRTTQSRPDRAGYEGGTPHRTTFGGWIAGSPRNRLATAGDWITPVQQGEYGRSSSPSDSRLRELANELRDCVDGATAGVDEFGVGPDYGLQEKPHRRGRVDCASSCGGARLRRGPRRSKYLALGIVPFDLTNRLL